MKPVSAVEAISPAVQHVRRILFQPFDFGTWLTLGFLSFLQILGEGGGYYSFKFPGSHRADVPERMKEAISWVSMHWTLVAILGFFGIFFVLALGVLFLWLSARATFCYIDDISTQRAEITRPWNEHRQIADSYFFWRLVFAIVCLIVALMFIVPIGVSIWNLVQNDSEISIPRVLFGSGVVVMLLPFLGIFVICVTVAKVLLVDFVAPIQYLRRVKCSEAVRVVIDMVKTYPGDILLYLILKLVMAIVIYCGVMLVGCLLCCIPFCCMALPIVGQLFTGVALQPIFAFKRSFSLFFLRGFGPEFDTFKA